MVTIKVAVVGLESGVHYLLLRATVDTERRRVEVLDVEDEAGALREIYLALPTLMGALDAMVVRGVLCVGEEVPS